ncbi:2-hydroxyacid dehydrogenase [Natronoflexus pectinivorans]|uniref:D-lactate dehydrogenase n=1 Tax=Natronoflexus pectinivorans TaxID=682526 RepID=A0A4R2GJ45_9BACT|nr:2-hydroxyacid dehydrogenase [Natronoflexus pectinivorans]TCO08323.1 D-lactate dehydrogenase [Natronoflexus pectinivorans]
MTKIALFSSKSYDKEYFERFKPQSEIEIRYFKSALNEDTTELAKGYDVVCVFVNDQINQTVLTYLKNHGTRLIALRCAGFNNVDLEAAKDLGIKVVRVPAYSPSAVAEHAMALILTLNRKTHKAYNRVREGNFSLERLTGFNIHQKTIGVIGTGKIGKAFCEICLGFGAKVMAYDLYPDSNLEEKGVLYSSIDELFRQSDIISLHCPLNSDTKHMINKDAFKVMKDGVMIINTSRGALVDTKAAIKALKKHKLGYLGIDVYEQEENLFFHDHSESIIEDELIMRLISFPNVLITSHQAFFTHEALEQITTTTYENITDFAEGNELKNEVKSEN